MDLDVKIKGVILGACFLIVSTHLSVLHVYLLICELFNHNEVTNRGIQLE